VNDLDSTDNTSYFNSLTSFDLVDKQIEDLYTKPIATKILILKAELLITLASYDPSKCLNFDAKSQASNAARTSSAKQPDKPKKKSTTTGNFTSDKPYIAQKSLEIASAMLDFCLAVENISIELKCQCYYFKANIAYMKGELKKSESILNTCIHEFSSNQKK
jgi:hypothetical protein